MKLKQIFLSALVATTLVACGNLSEVSEQGTANNPIWPKIEDSTFNSDSTQYGSWGNRDTINLVEKGMTKKQILALLGTPHFNEGLFGVREWDYIFNFRENGEHKICQFKILFDKDMKAQSLLWHPENCVN